MLTHWKRCLNATGGHVRGFLSIRRCVNCENSYLTGFCRYDGVLVTIGIIVESVGMKIRFSRAEEPSIAIGMPWSFSTIQKTGVNSRNLLNAGDLRGLMRQYHEPFVCRIVLKLFRVTIRLRHPVDYCERRASVCAV